VLGQLGSRATGEDEPHAHGPLYLLPLLLAFGLPWTPAWLLGLGRGARPSRVAPADRFGVGAAVWGLLAPLLLLSVPTSKRELYLVPLFPCAALLAAWALHRATGPRAAVHLVRGFVAVGAGLAVAAVAAPFVAAALAGGSTPTTGPPWPRQLGRRRHRARGGGGARGRGAFAARRLRDRPAGAALRGRPRVGGHGPRVRDRGPAAFDRWKSFDAAAAAARPPAGRVVRHLGLLGPVGPLVVPHRRIDHLGRCTRTTVEAALPGAPPVLVLARRRTTASGRAPVARRPGGARPRARRLGGPGGGRRTSS
jgi:hypothetical protein